MYISTRRQRGKKSYRVAMVFATALLLTSCNKTILKLSIPQAFKDEATAVHVNGSRTRLMSFANYSTTKIKRGAHVKYPGWGRGFFLENIVLNHFGIGKEEHVEKEKDRFRYTISNGKNAMQVFGKEQKITRSIEYKLLNGKGPFSSFDQLQQYSYIFSVLFTTDTSNRAAAWELVMTNMYDRKSDVSNGPFAIIRPDESGIATNGKDSLFIKPVSVKEAERADGRPGKLLFKVLAGYEICTPDGVVAIIDLVNKDIWFYNELDETDRLTIAAISTALFARRVSNVQW